MDKNKDVPKETFMDTMSIMGGLYSFLWRPNNYRRQSAYDTPTGNIPPSISISYGDLSKKGVRTIKFSKNITIQVYKSNIIGIYKQDMVGGVKLTYWIESKTLEGFEARLQEKKDRIRVMVDDAIKKVARRLNLRLRGSIFWARHEDWIKGEDYIDRIPRECIIHDTIFKKVYSEGVEFTGFKGVEPTSRVKNYIKNRALEDVTPELVGVLRLVAPLAYLKGVVRVVSDVFEYEDVVRALGDSDREEFESFLFRL